MLSLPQQKQNIMAKTKLEQLFDELGKIDQRRRTILLEIHRSPEYLKKYITDTLDSIVKSATWMKRTGTEKTVIPSRGEVMGDKVMRLISYNIKLVGEKITQVVVTYQLLTGETVDKNLNISTTRDLHPQLHQNLEAISQTEYNRIKKQIEKNIEIANKRKSLSDEIGNLRKMLELKEKELNGIS